MSDRWLTNYVVLSLGLSYPVLNGLSVYWSWVHRVVKLYQSNPGYFPWDQYQESNVMLFIVRIKGYTLRHVKDQTPEMCLTAVRKDWNNLYHVKNKTPELLAAVDAIRSSGTE